MVSSVKPKWLMVFNNSKTNKFIVSRRFQLISLPSVDSGVLRRAIVNIRLRYWYFNSHLSFDISQLTTTCVKRTFYDHLQYIYVILIALYRRRRRHRRTRSNECALRRRHRRGWHKSRAVSACPFSATSYPIGGEISIKRRLNVDEG
jgi:hypothetical protein